MDSFTWLALICDGAKPCSHSDWRFACTFYTVIPPFGYLPLGLLYNPPFISPYGPQWIWKDCVIDIGMISYSDQHFS